jgi:hypothetical protein
MRLWRFILDVVPTSTQINTGGVPNRIWLFIPLVVVLGKLIFFL